MNINNLLRVIVLAFPGQRQEDEEVEDGEARQSRPGLQRDSGTGPHQYRRPRLRRQSVITIRPIEIGFCESWPQLRESCWGPTIVRTALSPCQKQTTHATNHFLIMTVDWQCFKRHFYCGSRRIIISPPEVIRCNN